MSGPGPRHFDKAFAAQYERKIRASIPGYEALHAMARDLMHGACPARAHILCVGAGTGMEIVTLGRSEPGWRFTAVDTSAEMGAICERNLAAAGMSDRVTIHVGGLSGLPAGEPFQAATSLLVAHFLPTAEERTEHFRALAARLEPRGLLVAAELLGDRDQEHFTRFFAAWKRHYIANGIDPAEADQDFARTERVVKFLAEATYERILAAAGFAEAWMFYRALLFSGWIARRRN